MSAGVAPGDIIIAIGSPGTTLSSTNTIVATPLRVTTAIKRRLAAGFMNHARRADQQTAPSPALAGEGWGEGRGNYDGPYAAAIARRKTGVFDALWRHLLPREREKGS